jgi:hypothetical protein
VSAALNENKVDASLRIEYNELLQQLQNNPQLPPSDNLIPTIGRRIPIGPCPTNNSQSSYVPPRYFKQVVQTEVVFSGGLPRQITQSETSSRENAPTVDVGSLRRFWQAPSYIKTREEWVSWLGQLRTQVLHQSSSPALRACAVLAERYPTLAA